MDSEKRQLFLKLGNQVFIFRYETGKEKELIAALYAQAANPETVFSEFDAFVLTWKVFSGLSNSGEVLSCGQGPEEAKIGPDSGQRKKMLIEIILGIHDFFFREFMEKADLETLERFFSSLVSGEGEVCDLFGMPI